MKKPTEEQLKNLYQAASEFKKAQPWNELYDADLICIKNPNDGTIGYCSIMGRNGEHYALGVYLGDRGIFGFYEIMKKGGMIPSHQVLSLQDCIMCSFEDRDQLSNEDRKQIKTMGLSFRGRNAWPLFRRFEPGYYPWYINEEECAFLTHALKQTLFVVDDLIKGKLNIDFEHGKTILRYSDEKDGELKWYNKEMQLTVPRVIYNPVEINDDILIRKIKKAGSMRNVSIQADISYMPSPVQEKRGERPYFPRVFIIAEQKSGLILDFKMYQDINDDVNIVLNKLINIFLQKGIPKEIHVRNEEVGSILEDLCKNRY